MEHLWSIELRYFFALGLVELLVTGRGEVFVWGCCFQWSTITIEDTFQSCCFDIGCPLLIKVIFSRHCLRAVRLCRSGCRHWPNFLWSIYLFVVYWLRFSTHYPEKISKRTSILRVVLLRRVRGFFAKWLMLYNRPHYITMTITAILPLKFVSLFYVNRYDSIS